MMISCDLHHVPTPQLDERGVKVIERDRANFMTLWL